jgi:outer membrane receptor protein involved in Fe transport
VTTGGLFSNGKNQTDSTTSDGFTSRVIAMYDLNDIISSNAQVAKGFRLGGANDPLNESLCNANDFDVFGGFQDYEDETLTNYEVGMKAAARSWSANNASVRQR